LAPLSFFVPSAFRALPLRELPLRELPLRALPLGALPLGERPLRALPLTSATSPPVTARPSTECGVVDATADSFAPPLLVAGDAVGADVDAGGDTLCGLRGVAKTSSSAAAPALRVDCVAE
jgi:hypothetical protein